jgi:hypothetical protein
MEQVHGFSRDLDMPFFGIWKNRRQWRKLRRDNPRTSRTTWGKLSPKRQGGNILWRSTAAPNAPEKLNKIQFVNFCNSINYIPTSCVLGYRKEVTEGTGQFSLVTNDTSLRFFMDCSTDNFIIMG